MLLLFQHLENTFINKGNSSQHLPKAVVQVLTDPVALMFTDSQNFQLQSATFRDVPDDTAIDPLIVNINFNDGKKTRESGTILPQAHHVSAYSDKLLITGIMVVLNVIIMFSSIGFRHQNFHILTQDLVGGI